MTKKKKLARFAEVFSFPNVLENFELGSGLLSGEGDEQVELKGRWNTIHFKNSSPISLELACGKGEYTLGLSRRYPERNFIGVDIKGARIWRGAKTALEDNVSNAAFLRTRIEYIDQFFNRDEVDEIWITFPDPFPKKENRRLTAPIFLEKYAKILNAPKRVHLKTDDLGLYEYTLQVIEKLDWVHLEYSSSDIYNDTPLYTEELTIKTFYERMHLQNQKKIKYIQLVLQG